MLRKLLSILIIANAAIWGAGAISVPASAHQQKAALTQVLFNPRSGNIEVVHRFYLHDAEEAVRQLFGVDADIYAKEETQFNFAQYTVNKFALWDGKDSPVELGLVGYEIDGNFFFVYQESENAEDIQALTIRHDVLRDIWPEQMNTVNVEGRGDLQTVLFDGENTLQVVVFD